MQMEHRGQPLEPFRHADARRDADEGHAEDEHRRDHDELSAANHPSPLSRTSAA